MTTIPHDAIQKQCTQCKNLFPPTTSYFDPDHRMRSGLRPYCKECRKKRVNVYNRSHKEGKAAYMRQYYIDHREHLNKRNREDYLKNADKYLEMERERRKGKEAEYKQYQKNYRQTHKAERNAYQHNRNARKKANGGTHTSKDVQAQYKRQKGRCYWCNKDLAKYHVDHVVPVSRGGSNAPSNLVVSCPTCNTARKSKLPHEWAQGGRLL